MSVEDRYYTPKEYEKLSPAKKNGLRAKRKKRGHQPGHGTKSPEKSPRKAGQSISNKRFEKRIVSALRRLTTHDSDESDHEDEQSNDGVTNRNHGALRRREG